MSLQVEATSTASKRPSRALAAAEFPPGDSGRQQPAPLRAGIAPSPLAWACPRPPHTTDFRASPPAARPDPLGGLRSANPTGGALPAPAGWGGLRGSSSVRRLSQHRLGAHTGSIPLPPPLGSTHTPWYRRVNPFPPSPIPPPGSLPAPGINTSLGSASSCCLAPPAMCWGGGTPREPHKDTDPSGISQQGDA